jgi:hypothetical protein
MAHFAELNENNIVKRVIVVDNENCLDGNNIESEQVGVAFCNKLLGGTWKQTSYNGTFRKNYAGTGYKYDSERDAFIAPKLYVNWILNEETCQWESPIPYPDDDKRYLWNENKGEWEELIPVE